MKFKLEFIGQLTHSFVGEALRGLPRANTVRPYGLVIIFHVPVGAIIDRPTNA